MNEMMISKIKEFSSENKLLDVKIVELEVNCAGSGVCAFLTVFEQKRLAVNICYVWEIK